MTTALTTPQPTDADAPAVSPVAIAPPLTLSPARARGIGMLRIAFGLVWAVDAAFKWSPSFINKFSDYLTGARDGQPQLVKDWIDFWIKIVKVDPHVFAHLVAIGETAVAIGLILGAFSNLSYFVGGLLVTVIWTTAEGFGGPYTGGSTDIGAGIMYVLVFVGLGLAGAGRYLGLDTRLSKRLGHWNMLASSQYDQAEVQPTPDDLAPPTA